MLSTAPGALVDIPVVLLDLDGTLVDSGPGILDGLAHAFAICGEPLPEPEVLRTFIGPPLSSSFRGTLGLSAERSEQLRLAYTAHYRTHGLLDAPPYPGIPELLDGLAEAGRTLAVATNKPETTARRLLEHQGLADRFALIGGTDRASGRNDKSAVIGSVLERLDLANAPQSRTGTVMIGDRIHDAEGAAEHGILALLVGWGYGGSLEQAADVPRVATVAELSALMLG
jgi:phosphoglycolate phosphatase